MTRRRKKQRAAESCDPECFDQVAAGAADRLVSGSAPQIPSPYSLLAVCALLLLAVVAVFGQTAGHNFVNFDDDHYVYENRHVRGGLTREGTVWAITAFYAGNWHPLTWLSHTLDWRLYHFEPGGHHLTSVLLHAAAAVVLFLALRRMTRRSAAALWPSAWVAAVFAIHPLRVESVAWVAERKDVLSGLFFMLTLWFYAYYAQRPASWGRYLLVVASFALGLTAKPMLVVLPFVLLLLDYWPLGRAGSRERGAGSREQESKIRDLISEIRRPPSTARQSASKNPAFPLLPAPCSLLPAPRSLLPLLVEKIPLFVLAAASCAVTLAAQRGAMLHLEQLAFGERVANAAVAYVAYLGKMLYPAGLAVFYPLPKEPLPAGEVAAAIGVLLAISTAAFAARRKCPYLLFGWLWYLGTLVPVIGLVQVGSQAMADRYTYLTQIGLYMALAWGAADAARAWPHRRPAIAALSALVAAGLIVCAWQQTRHWRDSEALWTHALACTAQNPIAENSLGNALSDRGEVGEAIAHYRQAVEIEPDYAPAHHNLGRALAGRGEVEEAIAQYRKALRIKPDYAEAHTNLGDVLTGRGEVDEAIVHYRQAVEIRPDYVEAHNNLGNALAGRGEFDEAIAHYRRVLEIEPDFAKAHNNLGYALAIRNEEDEAIAHYRRAVEIEPDYAEAHFNLGNALAGRGEADDAIAQYRQALAIKPDFADAHNNLGYTLAGRGEIEEAIAQYRWALEIKPDYAEAHFNLGSALAGQRDVEGAIAHYRKAVEIKPGDAEAHFNLGYILANRGEVDDAIAHYQRTLEIKPDYAEAHNNLANVLTRRGEFEDAIVHYRKALEIKPDNMKAHFSFGNVLADRGRNGEALEQYQKALDLATARNDVATADMIRAQIKLHQPVAPGGKGP